jgi:ubiquinone/menaquinone biosynthesis C-methylase UbiE
MTEHLHHEPPPSAQGKVLHRAFLYDALAHVHFFGKENRFRHKILDLARLRPGDSLLDIGCGTGTLALAAQTRVGSEGHIYGIDASPQMIMRATKKARQADANIEFRIAPAEALPFPDATFDIVLSTLMLHHLPDGILVRCLGEALRVLKNGGCLLAVDFGGGATQRKKSFLGRLGHHHSFDLDRIVPSLKEIGFEGIETGEMGFFNLRYLCALSPRE